MNTELRLNIRCTSNGTFMHNAHLVMDTIKIAYSFLAPDRTVPYERVGRFVALLQAEHPGRVISLVHDIEMDCSVEDIVPQLIFLHENGFITYDIIASTLCAHAEVRSQLSAIAFAK